MLYLGITISTELCRYAKFFYDLAKATFTAMVVGDVVTMFLKEDVTTTAVWLFVTGLITTSLLSAVGYRISKM